MQYPIPENRCGTCRWFSPTHTETSFWNGSTKVEAATKGKCRRLPPVPLMPGGSITPVTSWPSVHDVEWCGEFESIVTTDIENEVQEWTEDKG